MKTGRELLEPNSFLLNAAEQATLREISQLFTYPDSTDKLLEEEKRKALFAKQKEHYHCNSKLRILKAQWHGMLLIQLCNDENIPVPKEIQEWFFDICDEEMNNRLRKHGNNPYGKEYGIRKCINSLYHKHLTSIKELLIKQNISIPDDAKENLFERKVSCNKNWSYKKKIFVLNEKIKEKEKEKEYLLRSIQMLTNERHCNEENNRRDLLEDHLQGLQLLELCYIHRVNIPDQTKQWFFNASIQDIKERLEKSYGYVQYKLYLQGIESSLKKKIKSSQYIPKKSNQIFLSELLLWQKIEDFQIIPTKLLPRYDTFCNRHTALELSTKNTAFQQFPTYSYRPLF